MDSTRYVPALGDRRLTGLYDPVVASTTRERRFKTMLLRQAALRTGDAVLDLGCGSGTLMLMALAQTPDISIRGVDGDPEMLAKARAKASAAGVALDLTEAMAQQLPYEDASFDVVLSSLFFHHLDRPAKRAALREAARVLKPGGALHVADWGRPSNALMSLAFHGIQLLDGYETTADHRAGLLPTLISEAGFAKVAIAQRLGTMFGTIELFAARTEAA